MRVVPICDPARREDWCLRLQAIGAEIGEGIDGGEADLVLVVEPAVAGIGTLFARLEGPGAPPVVVLSDDEALARACALIGALLLPAGLGDAALGLALRFTGRLAGEAGRRRSLEGQRDALDVERRALRSLAPFQADGMILGAATGRYRAQRLLASGAALVMVVAIDEQAAWAAAFGRDAAARTEAAVAALLVGAPARLGDILHSRGALAGWGLWLAGQDRAAASAIANRLLDLIEARHLRHDRSRADSAVTISIGIAPAPAESAASEAEARASHALAHAAALGGNRIRWSG
ncbi:hypothetical protein [Zavarzinia aquatilis]|uniref:GGDEF domain-containing protein n=1 Tax=Zavarzinia aquatilis TaxID=2211142 RepID=A0A317DTY4_9PROT|nr:hypothetical protein [Zavarzinia aquatilis]PWR18139.1 hypothetical protein DKG74_20055 [Zavarzinia aquatilis]